MILRIPSSLPHELVDQFRRLQRGAAGGRPAHAVADQADLRKAQRLDEADQMVGTRGLGVGEAGGIGRIGLAETHHVIGDDAHMPGEERKIVGEVGPAVGTRAAAMDQHQRIALAHFNVMGTNAITIDELAFKLLEHPLSFQIFTDRQCRPLRDRLHAIDFSRPHRHSNILAQRPSNTPVAQR
jgi:hypothetical protein